MLFYTNFLAASVQSFVVMSLHLCYVPLDFPEFNQTELETQYNFILDLSMLISILFQR